MIFATAITISAGANVLAQEATQLEEVVITGTRATIQNSIAIKRDATQIVEALSAQDIGDIPALSIGEAIETLTGAASHIEQGGATEISIRGMGPYLGSTVMNGREATNGSGDRSVNFSQFPSELFNKIAIYKTQQASFIEGGVSGQITLDTLKPLDYGQQRFQVDLKGNYNPDNSDIKPWARELEYGNRITASYVDQFEFDNGQALGISIGGQLRDNSNPEQEYRTSNTWYACTNDPTRPGEGVYADERCDQATDLDLAIDPDTGVAPDQDVPVVFTPSQRHFRQNITDDERESIFGALQWQPNEDLDINADFQVSDRTFTETRNDLTFSNMRHIDPDGLVVTDTGAILANGVRSLNNDDGTRMETNSQYMERIEEYVGGGIGFEYQVNEDLVVSADVSYSETSRQENIIQTRLRSSGVDLQGNALGVGNPDSDEPPVYFEYPGSGSGSDVMLVTLQNYDVTNPDNFWQDPRTRIDLNQKRDHKITAIRGDLELQTDWAAITSIESGLRVSKLEYESFPRVRLTEEYDGSDGEGVIIDDAGIAAANRACRNPSFPEAGFLSEPSGGQNLITNVDASGNVIAEGTGNTYATFDARCLVTELYANAGGHSVPGIPAPVDNAENIDVEEETIAAYIQANYSTEWADTPVHGNFGLRVVHTSVDSVGLRDSYTVVVNADETIELVGNGEFNSVTGGSSYTELLPSVSLVVDLREDLLLRAGIFRGLSRPDPGDLGNGRSSSLDGDTGESVEDIIDGGFNANGNPDLEPLLSWNYDISLDWYPNDDTILAGALYYKDFQGGFKTIERPEEFIIDGETYTADIQVSATDNDTTTLYGFELTAAHTMSYLPGALSGLGGKLSYNKAFSDFEFEDGRLGRAEVEDSTGEVISQRAGLIAPSDLFGFSDEVMSAQVFWGIGDLDVSFFYKYRSDYFQQYITTPERIRYVGEREIYEAKIRYKLTDNIQLSFEGINLFDEPKTQYIPVIDNVGEINSYGPRYYLGLKAKF